MSGFRHVFCGDAVFVIFFPRCCGVDSPPMSPSLLYLKPLRNSNTFLHVIYKSKKKTNLLCILNNVFQYSKIRTRKRNAKKSIKTEKNLESSPFWNPESTELESGIQYSESGIHRVESRIQDCHGFPYMGRRQDVFHLLFNRIFREPKPWKTTTPLTVILEKHTIEGHVHP